MNHFNWGLVGPGGIAQRFAEAVAGLPGVSIAAVHGRNPDRARAFAQRWAGPDQPAPRVEADLDSLLADPDIDAVYVATPHSGHAEIVRACLLAGKPVLCEKPLAPTLAQAADLVALAGQRQVFLMEALWTRFLPVYRPVAEWIQRGAIGRVQAIQSSFCFHLPYTPETRHFNPALAGGALLDIGIYNLAMSRWALETDLGACPELTGLQAVGQLAPTGLDRRVAATLAFEGGAVAQFVCAFDGSADNGLHLFGERGSISLPSGFWCATEAVLRQHGAADVHLSAPFRINGFEGEIEEAMRCVRAGLGASPVMPLHETLALASGLDALRAVVGVRYPFE